MTMSRNPNASSPRRGRTRSHTKGAMARSVCRLILGLPLGFGSGLIAILDSQSMCFASFSHAPLHKTGIRSTCRRRRLSMFLYVKTCRIQVYCDGGCFPAVAAPAHKRQKRRLFSRLLSLSINPVSTNPGFARSEADAGPNADPQIVMRTIVEKHEVANFGPDPDRSSVKFDAAARIEHAIHVVIAQTSHRAGESCKCRRTVIQAETDGAALERPE